MLSRSGETGAEDLDVVADVPDHRHSCRVDGADEPARETAPPTPPERRTTFTARGAVRARPVCAARAQADPRQVLQRVDVVGEVRDRSGDRGDP